MRDTTDIGMNRTGLAAAPARAKAMLDLAPLTAPPEGSAGDTLSARALYAREADEPIGTVPPPATRLQARELLKGALKGERLTVLIDKLGERLAFERTGVRLYEGLLVKLDAFGSWDGGPTREDLEQLRDEEHAHFKLVSEALTGLGGDPTAVTPSADVAATASEGVLKIIADPRTKLRECIDAIAIAELTDNDCWPNLTELIRAAGYDDMVPRFEQAIAAERRHLELVRGWIAAALGTAATVVPEERARITSRLKAAPRPRPAGTRRPAASRSTGRKATTNERSGRAAETARGAGRGKSQAPSRKTAPRRKTAAKVSRRTTARGKQRR